VTNRQPFVRAGWTRDRIRRVLGPDRAHPTRSRRGRPTARSRAGDHGVFETEHALDQGAPSAILGRRRCAAARPETGTDFHPDARRSPRVRGDRGAGRGSGVVIQPWAEPRPGGPGGVPARRRPPVPLATGTGGPVRAIPSSAGAMRGSGFPRRGPGGHCGARKLAPRHLRSGKMRKSAPGRGFGAGRRRWPRHPSTIRTKGRTSLTTVETAEKPAITPVELGGTRGGPDVPTLRSGQLWIHRSCPRSFSPPSSCTRLGRLREQELFRRWGHAPDLISPFYSPCLAQLRAGQPPRRRSSAGGPSRRPF